MKKTACLLTSSYIASNYGGSITAVLSDTLGTSSAAITAMQGYPLTHHGMAGKELEMFGKEVSV